MANNYVDALDLAKSIRDGKVSCSQAFEDSWQAIELHNPSLGAVCFKSWDLGQAQAKLQDSQLSSLTPNAREKLSVEKPFFGVPSLLKDLATAAVGLPSQMGSRAVNQGIGEIHWPLDSELVKRYKSAGLNLFGRTTSPELGISASTEARAYDYLGGPTRNPFSKKHSSGGSSGGAASAVASRMVLIANASDGAGSIRIPASCCGLYGLKPSRGLMPAGPLIGEAWGGLATEHVLTHSVRDSVAMLKATMGADIGAPYAAPRCEAGSIGPLKIALCDTTFDGAPVDTQVSSAVHLIAARCEALGHQVVMARPPVNTLEVIDSVVRLMACGTAMVVNRWAQQIGMTEQKVHSLLEPATLSAVVLGRSTSAPDYLEILSRIHRITREVAAFHETYDVLLCPVLAEPPARLGRFAMSNTSYLDYRLGPEGLWKYSPFTPLANATGQPSMSIPAAKSFDGLPLGAMLTGRLGEDFIVLELAAELEKIGKE
jgi:amidase